MGYICPVCHTENSYSQPICRVCGAGVQSGYLSRERRTGRLLLQQYADSLHTWLYAVCWPALCIRSVSRVLLAITLILVLQVAASGDPMSPPDPAAVISACFGRKDAMQVNQMVPTWIRRHTMQIMIRADDLSGTVQHRIADIVPPGIDLSAEKIPRDAADRIAAKLDSLRPAADREPMDITRFLTALIQLYR